MAKKRATRTVKPRGPKLRVVTAAAPAAPAASVAATYLQAAHRELLGQRSSLDAQILQIESMLRSFGNRPAVSAAAVGRAPRSVQTGSAASKAYRSGSLKAHIADVLSTGGVQSVKDIADGVMASGYATKNKTLAKSVGIALTEMKNVIKVSRGKFRLR